jgi:RNA polymerase sigma-70 factor (ECF subfamily)
VVYRWLWDATEAADVVQDAFVRLWAMRDRVQPATVEPLVYRIALNQAANRRRRRRLWRWVGLEPAPDPRPSATDHLEGAELDGALRAAVDALPEKLRRVVMLCELSGMSYQQVADVLGVPVGTVGSRRNAALARLRAVLGEEVDHGA